MWVFSALRRVALPWEISCVLSSAHPYSVLGPGLSSVPGGCVWLGVVDAGLLKTMRASWLWPPFIVDSRSCTCSWAEEAVHHHQSGWKPKSVTFLGAVGMAGGVSQAVVGRKVLGSLSV